MKSGLAGHCRFRTAATLQAPCPYYRKRMTRTNLFFKVEIEHDRDEHPERLGNEICRQIMKFYGVREAEMTNFTRSEE